MSKIIGLIGFKGTGKSTAAKYLQKQHGFVRHNMKDGLKLFMIKTLPDVLAWCREYYQMTNEELFDKKPPLMRYLMVNIGTDLVRVEIDNDFWVNFWSERQFAGVDTVVDDIRFKNEAHAIKKRKGILIRLVRKDIPTGGGHPSETEQLEIEADFTIETNEGEQETVYKKLDEIVKNMV